MHIITISCVLFLWVCTLTTVKCQDCTRQKFLESKLYDANFDTTNLEESYSGGKQVRVGCKVGYTGFFKIICTQGEWISKGTKCQPRSCGHPGDAQFADFQLEEGNDFVFGSKVVYTCHKGYQMVSRINYRRCMAAGWDGVVPVCEAQQCPVINVDDNVQVNGDPEEATFGNVVRFSCKSNTEILFGPAEIYCDDSGSWSSEAPKCKAIKCEAPKIENGIVHGNIREYNEHDVLHFDCIDKYKRTEERPSKCTKIGMRAEWSPTPMCEPIKCRLTLPPLEGTSYEPVYRNVFSPDEQVTVTCGEKYWITSPRHTSAVTTCTDSGEWTIRPVCKEVTCSNQRPQHVYSWNVYWGQKMILYDTARYRCRANYKSPDGSYMATCTRDGWRPNPLCQEITCVGEDIPHANIVNRKWRYTNNQRADYECEEGYKGRPTRTCGENGWTGDSQCTEITCEREDIPHANILSPKLRYTNNQRAEYECEEGYKGRPTRTCGEYGWTGDSQCTAILCDKPVIQDAGIIDIEKESYHHRDQVQFQCKNGMNKGFTVTCEQGNWTEIQSCAACPKPDVPNGFVKVRKNNYKLYYTCNPGYKLYTDAWWGEAECLGIEWSESVQCIEETKCGEIPAIPHAKVERQHRAYEQNESVPITCETGYQAQDDHLICQEGNWTLNGTSLETATLQHICTPTEMPCGHPPKFENAVVVTSYQQKFLSGSAVTYQCRARYIMDEENTGTLQCIDGEWEKKSITCTSL
ncbi:complement factor H-like isoform X4 [Acanthopagrus latus]|uniref:complement factor H-like isoform X4 n=1 Tax=Acanthopagrus latus TaxID=8177 RepID=UPI00187CD979|nr:complement factor H-like isoform X4 [Acanthopagrus latus]